VYNGTDLETFRPIPGTPVETDLLFVGRTDDRKKGIGTLLEALTHLPESVRLKIVDGRIGERSLVPRLLRRWDIAHRVVLQRRMLTIPELVAEYSTARIAVVPSFFEGFGFPASEAMACGLPVVANAAGALPEVVGTDGSAGLLVAPRDARGLADAIQSLLADPARAARMGRNARARVSQLFRWRDAAERLVDVFEETRRAAHRRPRAA
jgi:glycosyltransferase involved in cell wall biosynthesis